MPYVAPHNWVAGETATEALMDEINNNLRALFPVGSLKFVIRAATTVETFSDNCWLECNGVSVLRADYPDLNTLLSGLAYPFGTVDGTHMTLPDLQGRELVAMASGGHADVNALGDSDGLAKASRSPKHNSTNGLSGSGGTLSGAPGLTGAPGVGSLALPNHVHPTVIDKQDFLGGSAPALRADTGTSGTASFTSGNPTSLPAITGAPSIGTLAATAGTLSVSGMSISGTIGPGGTRPTDTPAYLVAGVWLIKAVS